MAELCNGLIKPGAAIYDEKTELSEEKWALPRPEIPSGAALSSVPWHTCHSIQKRDFAGSTAAFERLRRTSNR